MSRQDLLHRYLFEDLDVRGELVQLSDAYASILNSQAYPAPLRHLLGELMVATSLLTATLKFEGEIAVQIQGEGPVTLAVINGDHEQHLRGVGRWDGDLSGKTNLHELFGKGHIVITITPKNGERYQGVVGLEHETLTGCLEHYFMQSEQLETRLWLHIDHESAEPQAAGILLQMLPGDKPDRDANFEHLSQLTNTTTAKELFELGAEEMLYRLYNQEEVRLFEPQPVKFTCTCSRERCEGALLQVRREELDQILQSEDEIDMHCDYCGSHYRFNSADIDQLFQGNPGATLH